jgi:hypothetical protein
MQAKRGVTAGRLVTASLIASLGVALTGCGSDDEPGVAGAAATSTTSASSTTPTTAAETASESSKSSGSTTTPGATTPPPRPKAPTLSSITLGWIPPTRNSDGSPITNLAGYKIHYGTTSSEYTQTIALHNAGLTRYVVDSLPSGTYYFAIAAYNSMGVESPLSGEVSTILD